jgi:hypothetical protein
MIGINKSASARYLGNRKLCVGKKVLTFFEPYFYYVSVQTLTRALFELSAEIIRVIAKPIGY